MARSALIIGLGGTGEWVTTYVKKDLLEIVGGQGFPKNVRLLSFDLISGEAKVQGAGAGVNQTDNQRAQVGPIRLTKDMEFITVAGNIHQLSQQIANDNQPTDLAHYRSWFQAKDYLTTIQPSDFDLAHGAGQIRQFGRMALFYDLSSQTPTMKAKLTQALEELNHQIQMRGKNEQLEIIIIASLAGGTGAGLLLDVAAWVRHLAINTKGLSFVIRGVAVLPDAFPWGDQAMKARAFATWRELDRFMLINETNQDTEPIVYNQTEKFEAKTWSFDGLYFVGGTRADGQGVNLTNVAPEKGVFPAVASMISAILDEQAGKFFTDNVANLRQKRLEASKQEIPLYNSFGAYTIKVPVYYAEQLFSYELALDILRTLLPTSEDKEGKPILKPDARPDKGDKRGRDEVKNFLSVNPIEIATGDRFETIANTLFTTQVENVAQLQGGERQRFVLDYAEYATGEGGGASEMLIAFTEQLPDSISDDLRELQQLRDMQVRDKIFISKERNETTEQATSRYQRTDQEGVSHFIRTYYGYLDDRGELQPGKIGRLLEKCKGLQKGIFRRRLQFTLLNFLQGGDLQGSLGYTHDFLRELQNRLTDFQTFVQDVIRQRSGKTVDTRTDAQQALEYLINHPKKSQLGGLIKRDNVEAEEDYLYAVQRQVNDMKADTIYGVLRDTVGDLLKETEQAIDHLQAWVEALVFGNVQRNVESLETSFAQEIEEIRTIWQADQASQVQKQMDLSSDHTSDDRDSVLARLGWEVDEKLTLFLTVKSPDGDQVTKTTLAGQQLNATPLLNATRQQFQTRLGGKQIAKLLAEEYGSSEQLAEEMRRYIQPLYRANVMNTAGQRLGGICFVRLNSQINRQAQQFFDHAEEPLGVRQWLATKINYNPNDVTIVGSEDPYKMTIVRTDDLMEATYIDQYNNCQQAYIKHIEEVKSLEAQIKRGKHLHLYPSFVTAIEYEVRIREAKQRLFKPLHAKVVALLGNQKRLRTFFELVAYGHIERQQDSGTFKFWYQLNLDNQHVVYLTGPQEGEPDIFAAMRTFLITRKDARPDKEIEINAKMVTEVIEQGHRDIIETVYRLRAARDLEFLRQLRQSEDKAKQDLADVGELIYGDLVGQLRAMSPYIINLLEMEGDAQTRIKQFFKAYAYGRIQKAERGPDGWYQLKTGRQEIHLSQPKRGQADIFEALETFIDPKKQRDVRTQGPGSRVAINFAEVEYILQSEERDKFALAVHTLRYEKNDPQGLVATLKGGATPKEQHLGQLVFLMYEEAYNELLKGSPSVANILNYPYPNRVTMFYDCCLHNFIHERRDRQSQERWLELRWLKKTIQLSQKTLTPSDIFQAIDTFVMVGGDITVGYNATLGQSIDYSDIERLLKKKDKGFVEMLRRLINPASFNNAIWELTQQNDINHIYLRKLVDLHYKDRLDELAKRSPRIVQWIRNEQSPIQELFMAYSYGFVTIESNRSEQWYQLTFTPVGGREVAVPLTLSSREEPNLFEAIETYIRGESAAPEGQDGREFDGEALYKLLQTTEDDKPEGAIAKLEYQLTDETGIVAQLRQKGQKEVDYEYLADLIQFLLEERRSKIGGSRSTSSMGEN